MTTCSKCGENNSSLKNEVVSEVLKILSAIISTDGSTFDEEVEKFNVNEELVCALKVFRESHKQPIEPIIPNHSSSSEEESQCWLV